MPLVAITREVSPAFANCELTHLGRVPIDVDVARAQHDAYENALEDAGYRIERLTAVWRSCHSDSSKARFTSASG